MLENGVPVSLAVDGSASNDSSNMLRELKTCLLVHRLKSGVKSMPAEDVLWLATRGGAQVLGRDDIGSLEAVRQRILFYLMLKKSVMPAVFMMFSHPCFFAAIRILLIRPSSTVKLL